MEAAGLDRVFAALARERLPLTRSAPVSHRRLHVPHVPQSPEAICEGPMGHRSITPAVIVPSSTVLDRVPEHAGLNGS